MFKASEKSFDAKITREKAMQDVQPLPSQASINQSLAFEEKFHHLQLEGERKYIEVNGLKDHFQHKKNWSWFIMGLMFSMVVFQIVLICMVGSKAWDFTEYQWLIPTLMIQYLVQIVGLAVL